jgi:predicted nucleic acid-binding protein
VIVVDAAVLASGLGDDGPDGDRCRHRLRGAVLSAPELIDLEVLSVYRRLTSAGRMAPRRASSAVRDLFELPLQRAPHAPLLDRCWELRENLTIYDAAYVALAERLEALLVTSDTRLARAPGVRCAVEVIE